MIKVSILDLVQVNDKSSITDAFYASARYAQKAEELGYHRFWVAEHHNSEAIASAATSVVIGFIASQTKTIRVGAGGVMLPNHSPLVIAEQFGTLEAMYPNRIDLGLGRAPGTDQMTIRALRRNPENSGRFPQDVMELKDYLAKPTEEKQVKAIPGMGSEVPLWILGSSTFGAQMAAYFGLPYAFASHFSPQSMMEALALYKAEFRPSEENPRPYSMIGVNVVCAKTDEEAKYLFTSRQQSFADLRRGTLKRFKAPIDDIESYWSPDEKIMASEMLRISLVGSPATIKIQLAKLLDSTKVDEIIVVGGIFDEVKKLESLEMFMDVVKSLD